MISSTTDPGAVPAPAGSRRTVLSRGIEWLLRRDGLRQVRSRGDLPPDRAVALERARRILELVDAMLDPSHPAHASTRPWIALLLCREAAYFAYVAAGVEGEGLRDTFDRDPAMTLEVAGDETRAKAVRASLLERTSAEASLRPLAVQRADALLARGFVAGLLDRADERRCTEQRLLLERHHRVLAAVMVVMALVLGAMLPKGLRSKKPHAGPSKSSLVVEPCRQAAGERCASSPS
jgi:hypothetical protein